MARPHALMESMPASANLNESPHSIDADLTKPRNRKKFLRDGLVGPPHAGRPVVRRMARELCPTGKPSHPPPGPPRRASQPVPTTWITSV